MIKFNIILRVFQKKKDLTIVIGETKQNNVKTNMTFSLIERQRWNS